MKLSLEYIAGIIDGEGSLTISKDRKYFKPGIAIALVKTPESEALLHEIQEILGGYIAFMPKEYWTKHGLNAKDQIKWRVNSNKDVFRVSKMLLPYLKLKQEQCRKVLNYSAKHL